MNRLLLFALSVLVTVSAWGASFDKHRRINDSGPYESVRAEVGPGTRFKAPASRAQETVDFTLAGDPYGAVRFRVSNSVYKHEGFEFNAENATLFAGNQITAVSVCTGINSLSNKNAITDAKIYLTYDLQSEPFYIQDVKLGTEAFTFYECQLNTPYTIEAGKPFYVICTFNNKTNADYYLVYDGLYYDNDEGGWCGYGEIGKVTWDNISEYYGFIPMKVVITGDKMPTNGVKIYGVDMPEYVAPNTEFSGLLGVKAAAAGEISNIEVVTTVGSQAPVTQTFNFTEPLVYGNEEIVTLSGLKSEAVGYTIPYTMEITKVNGVANSVQAKIQGDMMCYADSKIQRNVLIEEATGCWCGWCPRGIVLLEELRNKYTDGSLAIAALHNGDEMAIDECQLLLNDYISGFPSMLVNRKDVDINMTAFEEAYKYYRAMPAAVDIKATATVAPDDRTVSVTSTTCFTIDSDTPDRFVLSFYLTQDGMGPYKQTNYYSGGSNGVMGGFEKLPESTPVVYNDVARALYKYPGIENSLPSLVKGGTVNTNTFEIPLTDVTSDEFNVIAMVIDKAKGTVLNCSLTSAKKNNSVSSAVTDADAPVITATDGCITVAGAVGSVNIFTVDGRCVAKASGDTSVALSPGLYIVRAGSHTSKVRL